MTEMPMTREKLTQAQKIKTEVAVAMNQHIVAKEINHIDELRQKDTMRRLLSLASTREGLSAIQELKELNK